MCLHEFYKLTRSERIMFAPGDVFFATTSGVPIGGQLPASLGTAPLASTLEELKLRLAGLTGTLPPELGNSRHRRLHC
jgi:hypothetical protein